MATRGRRRGSIRGHGAYMFRSAAPESVEATICTRDQAGQGWLSKGARAYSPPRIRSQSPSDRALLASLFLLGTRSDLSPGGDLSDDLCGVG